MRSNFVLSAIAALLALVVFASPATADDDLRSTIRDEISKWSEAKDDNTFKVHWKNGLHLDSKNVQMKLGGLLMIDHYFVDDDDFVARGGPADASFESGVELRRARIANSGLLHGHVEWKLSVDFANPNSPELADGYIGLVNMDDCFGCLMPNIRVGHQRVPFGLERVTPLKYNTFMNRSSATDTFTVGRRYGVMLHDLFRGGQLGYQLGYFGHDSTMESDGEIEFDDGYALVARIFYTPWYDCECSCRRLHIGAGVMSITDAQNIFVGSNGPVGVGTTPNLVGGNVTRLGAADLDHFAWNIELALVYGPWSVQAEYFSTNFDDGTNDFTFTGWYAQLSYWLTGECRNYAHGVFGRTSPCCNFLDNDCCCYGGVEIAARYSVVDAVDAGINGGEMTDWVIGLNWHLNPNARIQVNYMNVNVEQGAFDESMTALGIRWQVDW